MSDRNNTSSIMTDTLPLWSHLESSARPKIRFWLPGAAVDEEDLRSELRALQKRGFGGVEIVVLERLTPLILHSKDGWGTENWNKMVAIIADETEKLGMTMDIANGPGWPVSSPIITSVQDKAVLYELTYGECRIVPGTRYVGHLPERRIHRSEGSPKLVHAFAYLEKRDKILEQVSYVDLMPYVQEKNSFFLDYHFPEGKEGETWVLFAFYGQPSAQKTGDGQYYVIDHLSKAGSAACEAYWEEILDKYEFPSMESVFCDSLEYEVSLDWTPKLLQEFVQRRGYSLLPYLPFIGLTNIYPSCDVPGYMLDDKALSEMINHDYLETVTECYCENHLAALEKMANRYGKTIRYQVGYNKPFEVERCPLFVGVPENEALGRPSLDYQKTMAAAVHYGRKKRYSFECAAEFGNSYGQDYEDLFWWVKRSLMAGMNAQVLHGASYSGKYDGAVSENGNIPGIQWPGYEAFSLMVSNYWNRTLSISDAKECMDTITRLNMIFRKQARVDCAVFRCSFSSDGLGSEFCLYEDDGKLSNRGYNYEFVSDYLLKGLVERVNDARMDIEGAGYKCLIIPQQNAVTYSFLKLIKELEEKDFPIIWQGEKPEHSLFFCEWRDAERRREWFAIRDEVWQLEGITHIKDLQEVPDALLKRQIMPDILLDGTMDITTAVRRTEKETYFILYGYNRVEYSPENPNYEESACSAVYRKGTVKGSYVRPGAVSRREISVCIKGKGSVCRCNPWSGRMEQEYFCYDEDTGYREGTIFLEEDEMVILRMSNCGSEDKAANKKVVETSRPIVLETLTLEEFAPNEEGELSFLRSGFREKTQMYYLTKLLPWRELDIGLAHFAGKGIYHGYIELDCVDKNAKYILELGNVCDTFTVAVNGQKTPFPDQVLKRVEVTELVHIGRNELEIEVVSNLYNRVFPENRQEQRLPSVYLPRNYGIWEEEYKKIRLKIVRYL